MTIVPSLYLMPAPDAVAAPQHPLAALPLAGPWGLALLIFLLLAIAGLYLVIRNPK
jgi:hypothetical protein